jgi:bifunctional DNA-binding transcriptional regulator/antitoxin component of YhaV-PrlF toxin-antitoxin module
MQVSLRDIGDAYELIIPDEMLDRLNIKIGDVVDATVEDGCVVLRPVRADGSTH